MNVNVATSWKEVNQDQLIRIAKVFYDQDINYASLFFALVDLKWYRPKDWRKTYRLSQVPISELKAFVQWIMSDTVLKDWKLSSYKGLFGPNSTLSNLSWQEFTIVDSLYCKYSQTENREHLIQLSSALFRPQGNREENKPTSYLFSGDHRIPFNPNIPKKHFKKVKRWPDAFHDAVFLNYTGIRRMIEKEFPRVFSSSNEEGSAQGLKGWKPVTISLSGDKFGDFNSIQKTPFKDVLTNLEMNAIQLENLKEKNNG